MRVALFGLILGASAALQPLPVEAMRAPPMGAMSLGSSVLPVEFWCSPGFEPRGRACVATLSRDEILIYGVDDYVAPRRHRRPRHGLRELY